MAVETPPLSEYLRHHAHMEPDPDTSNLLGQAAQEALVLEREVERLRRERDEAHITIRAFAGIPQPPRGGTEGECLMSDVEPITRTLAVLKLDQQRAGSPDEGGLFFTTHAEEPGYRPTVQLAPEMWRDMGNPESITIAIYPGDRQDLMEQEDFPA